MVNLTNPPTDGTEAPADTRIAELERQLAELRRDFQANQFCLNELVQAGREMERVDLGIDPPPRQARPRPGHLHLVGGTS